jgi:hypothetical protein
MPIVVLLAAAAVFAERRPVAYTAESDLQVGRLNVSTPGAIAGFAQAAGTLTSGYARAVFADGVVDPLAVRFHTTPGAIRSLLSTTPVPTSPIVALFATGPSDTQAVDLANAASHQLVVFLVRSNRRNPDAARLLLEIHVAAAQYEADLAHIQTARAAPHPPSAVVQRLAAAVEVDHVQLAALEASYQSTVGSEAVSSLLQPLISAHSASSNKSSHLQIALFAALVVGALLGLALATLRANVVVRRVLTAPPWESEHSEHAS